jgi:hypothetical protein
VIALMSLYVLLTGDFPGAAMMGVEEDSWLVAALLDLRDTVL